MRYHRPVSVLLAWLAPLALVAPTITTASAQDPSSAERGKELLARFDLDGDGKLDAAEKAALRESFRREREAAAEKPARKPEVPASPTLEGLLARFDRDGDGQLDAAEKAALRESFRLEREAAIAKGAGQGTKRETPAPEGPAAARPSPEELMARFDADGDGKLGEAERVALRESFRNQRAAAVADPPETPAVPAARGAGAQRGEREALLARFDTDGDGKLNEEERVAYRREVRSAPAAAPTTEAPSPRGEDAPAPPRPAPEKTPARPTAEEQLARFDTDGDGQLGDSERAAMRETFRRERAAQSGRAAPSRSDPTAAQAPPPQTAQRVAAEEPEELPAVYRRYDRDGDGTLSPAETRVAREALIRGGGAEARAPSSLPESARQFDLDGNGAIDETERRAAVHSLREQRAAAVGRGGGGMSTGTGVGDEASQSWIARAQAAIAEELARREAVDEMREKRLEQRQAKSRRDHQKTSLVAYQVLAKKAKGGYRPNPLGNGFKGSPRHGIERGKKRGSDYYRTKMQRRGGGRRGRGQNQYIR